MEASGISADAALKPKTSEVIAEFISKYGLIAILIAFPAYYGIQDLIDDGNLTRLGNNLADGLSNEEIAARWVVSNATVRTHVSRAMTKLRARDRAQLVVFAYRYGLAATPPAT